jgi:hypothetical protein
LAEVRAKTYTAILERDDGGVWCGRVRLDRRNVAVSDGPTIERTRERLREAVAALLDIDESLIDLELDVKLPRDASVAVERAKIKKGELESAREAAEAANVHAVRTLQGHGFSRRDAGSLLGVTRQRASQFANAFERGRAQRKRRNG